MKVKKTLGMLLCAAALLGLSCSGPTVAAVGESDDVVIIGGAGAGAAVDALNAALTMESSWIVGEPDFKTTTVGPDRLDDMASRRHIVLVGTWDDPDMSRIVRSRVGQMSPGDPPGSRVVEDIWAKGQVVMAVMADSEQDLESYVSDNAFDLKDALDNAARTRLAKSLRDKVAGTGAIEDMDQRFGWSLCPPSGYELFPGDEGEGLVFFRRVQPDRTIFVYWQDGDGSEVNEEFVVTKRNEMGSLHFDGDEIQWQRDFTVETVDFAGYSALRVSGWWGNRELVGGGPFRSYCFYVPSQKRVYLIDAALFAPGLDKMALMRNLDAALCSFRPAAG